MCRFVLMFVITLYIILNVAPSLAGSKCVPPPNCHATRYSVADIANAIKTTGGIPSSITSRSCMWGGAALMESGGGNLCACNANNFGILQLSRQNIENVGLTTDEYLLLPLNDQVMYWASAGAYLNNSSTGYKSIDAKISSTLHFGHVMDGPLAACSQFGAVVCNNDVSIIESGDPLPIRNGMGAIRCRDSRCNGGTANQDGSGETIVSWGLRIQSAIYESRCVDP
jgi:hypothetical protein